MAVKVTLAVVVNVLVFVVLSVLVVGAVGIAIRVEIVSTGSNR